MVTGRSRWPTLIYLPAGSDTISVQQCQISASICPNPPPRRTWRRDGLARGLHNHRAEGAEMLKVLVFAMVAGGGLIWWLNFLLEQALK